MKKLYFRTFQKVLFVFAQFLNLKEPKLSTKENSYFEIIEVLKTKNKKYVYLIVDGFIHASGILDPFLAKLDAAGIKYVIYSESKPNPTLKQVEDAYTSFTLPSIDAIVAIGGGSPLDLAKMVGIKAAYPKRSLQKFKGLLKVQRKIPLLFAIPTTVGTGSEATLAAVVSNDETHEKYAIMSPNLIPKYAFLDYNFIKTLPLSLISTTAMDALTHAIEAYLGKANTSLTKRYAKEATKAIFANVEKAYETKDKDALNALHLASYKAGVAFGRAYVGNVHAIAHTLGGFYDVPHGFANAVILPHVLRFYGVKIEKKLSELAYFSGVANPLQDSIKEAASTFIQRIEELNQKMGIPHSFDGIIKDEDLPKMINRAYHEANPLYPVPVIFSKKDFENIYLKINAAIERKA